MPAHCTHMLIVKSFGENVSLSVTAEQNISGRETGNLRSMR